MMQVHTSLSCLWITGEDVGKAIHAVAMYFIFFVCRKTKARRMVFLGLIQNNEYFS